MSTLREIWQNVFNRTKHYPIQIRSKKIFKFSIKYSFSQLYVFKKTKWRIFHKKATLTRPKYMRDLPNTQNRRKPSKMIFTVLHFWHFSKVKENWIWHINQTIVIKTRSKKSWTYSFIVSQIFTICSPILAAELFKSFFFGQQIIWFDWGLTWRCHAFSISFMHTGSSDFECYFAPKLVEYCFKLKHLNIIFARILCLLHFIHHIEGRQSSFERAAWNGKISSKKKMVLFSFVMEKFFVFGKCAVYFWNS